MIEAKKAARIVGEAREKQRREREAEWKKHKGAFLKKVSKLIEHYSSNGQDSFAIKVIRPLPEGVEPAYVGDRENMFLGILEVPRGCDLTASYVNAAIFEMIVRETRKIFIQGWKNPVCNIDQCNTTFVGGHSRIHTTCITHENIEFASHLDTAEVGTHDCKMQQRSTLSFIIN